MSLKDKLLNTVAPKSADADPDAAKTVEELNAAREAVAKFTAKEARLSSEQAQHDRKLGNAALAAEESGEHSVYQNMLAVGDKLADDLERCRRAKAETETRVRDLESKLHALGKRDLLKTFDRLGTALGKDFVDLAETYAAIRPKWEHIFKTVEKIRLAWPYGPVPEGIMLSHHEVASAFAEELYRLLPVHPLMPGPQIPLLPGARMNLLDDVSKQTPLVERFAAAKTAMLALIEAGPGAVSVPSAPVEAKPEQSAEPEQAPQPVVTGPAVDARAYVPPRKSLDHYLGEHK